jgi:aspartate/methionine/tyrosine aminotransferase
LSVFFSEFSPLATKFGAVNLGQGFPNWDPPEFIIKAAQSALAEQTTGFSLQKRMNIETKLFKSVFCSIDDI